MLHASTKKLIDRLAEMTDLAKLDWTESEDGTITYATEGYSVTLSSSPNELIINSKDGKELERAGAEELAATHNDDGTSYADIVATMTKEASRVAIGTETAISTLLAGMQEAPVAEPEEVETAADEASTRELQEDPGDDTEVLTDDSVEAVVADSAETADEPETKADETSTDGTESAGFAAETDESPSEPETLQAEDGSESADEVSVEAEPEADGESESDVTDAVARLADEVNQRDDTGLDAAAASAVGAVALAAGLTDETSVSEDEEEADDTPDEDIAFGATVAAEPEIEAATPPAYVPFGLEQTDDTLADTSNEAMPVAEEDVASESEVVAMPFMATQNETDAATTEDASEAELTPSEPPVTNLDFTSSENETFSAEPLTFETKPAEPETPEPEELAEPAAEPAGAHDSEFSAVPTTPEEIAPEPIPFETSAVEASVGDHEAAAPAGIVETPVAEPQSYSLSGIGAGFGLGALAAKTEASGIPGPSTLGAPVEDKVVIDATEDDLPEIDGKPALPASVTSIPSNGAADTTEAAQSTEPGADAEADMLKPRTRFNPWD